MALRGRARTDCGAGLCQSTAQGQRHQNRGGMVSLRPLAKGHLAVRLPATSSVASHPLLGPVDPVMSDPRSTQTSFHRPTSHRRSCASSVWQGAGARHWPKPREPLLRCASMYLSMHHGGSPCISVMPPRALPATPSHSRHAASQKRRPQVETRKTGATQSISKALRRLPSLNAAARLSQASTAPLDSSPSNFS